MLVDVDPLRMIIIFFLKVRDSRSHQQFSSVFCPSSFSFSFTLLFVVHVFGLFDLLILPRKEKQKTRNKKPEKPNSNDYFQLAVQHLQRRPLFRHHDGRTFHDDDDDDEKTLLDGPSQRYKKAGKMSTNFIPRPSSFVQPSCFVHLKSFSCSVLTSINNKRK